MNFTRKDKLLIAEEITKTIAQQENMDKDQDLQFLETEMAKLFIATPEELEEERYPGKWLFDEFQPLDEETGIGYFVFLSSVGFIPGVLVKQHNELTIKAWPALFSVIGTEGVIQKIQSAYYKSAFIANSKWMNTFYNQLVQIARPGEIPQTFTYAQQKNLYEEVVYSRDLSEFSAKEQVRLHELLHTKPVSLNFFNALDNRRKWVSVNYWEVFAARNRWLNERKVPDQQIQFVQLKKERLYYGLYSRV
ncbi:hypothetical protein A5844_001464 [Enterococcus sp. 10A9_DIV0425]|uniref:Uncharacterized protein n=1 Tax=Candidatus Enterococcus wittei TaxID=1987383 RepID=A0A242K0Y8_9ENTE|nr:hypothetical protein [Enterococcus sp. 10A9_DIV0425]OTP11329.1 hypothetical protein A5844_001464 [Enterococcus sp. 10A9_DIV0425]THE13715.1 hypothetical protein E1H99_05660 [Enterococcus hirae]